MRLVNLLQPLFHDMRVDLRGGNVRVPQHQLHRPQVDTALQQVRGKAVPQHVRSERHAKSRAPPVRGQNLPDTHAAERAATAVDEKRWAAGGLADELWTGVAKISFDHA